MQLAHMQSLTVGEFLNYPSISDLFLVISTYQIGYL